MTSKDLQKRARAGAVDRLLPLLVPSSRPETEHDEFSQTRKLFREKLESGMLDARFVEIEIEDKESPQALEIDFTTVMKCVAENRTVLIGPPSSRDWPVFLKTYSSLDRDRPQRRKKVTIVEALNLFEAQELEKLKATATSVDYSSSLSLPSNEILLIERSLLKQLRGNPGLLYSISPREFEEFIEEYFNSLGFEVALTAQTRDGGCDLIAFSQDQLGIKTKYVIEAKHYKPEKKVGVGSVRQLSAVRQKFGAHHGVLVTSSFFTPDAIKENQEYYGLHLEDYNRLVEWLKDKTP